MTRAVHLARQPGTHIAPDDFEVRDVVLPAVQSGQARVRNLFVSLDPYMRLPLTARAGLHPAKGPGDLLGGAAVGVVEESAYPALVAGTLVVSQSGWTEGFVAPVASLRALPADTPHPSWYLGVLGLTGITAWLGVERVLKPVRGETVYVSGAAGAVGSIACGLARRRGATVIGTAGTDAKCRWLIDEIGCATAGNYHREPVSAFLARAAPGGIDASFDNVGGETLDAILGATRPGGRIGACGAISLYESDDYRGGPADFFRVIEQGLTITGFNAGQAGDDAPAIVSELQQMAAAGDILVRETVVEGIAAVPAAFASLFTGETTGKLIARLG
jgi:NADPH-dependent curcumin reductase CurA